MDNTTKQLFCKFPREVSLARKIVYNLKEFKNYVDYTNGVDSVYTSVFSANLVIDKLFFDFDFGEHVLEDAQKFYAWVLEQGYPIIPIATGNMTRCHFYVLVQSKIWGKFSKIMLTRATRSILESVFGPIKQASVYLGGKQHRVLRNKDRIIAPDPACVGDVRRLTRIPQSLRPNLNAYCTYLPPKKFLDMSASDIVKHTKRTHHYDYNINLSKAPALDSFEYDFDEKDLKGWEKIVEDGEEITTSNPNLFLKGLLRPCLYNSIITQHPNHPCRCASTIDLLLYGYTPEQITDLYSTLGWNDFEKNYCMKMVKSCIGYKPYSCSKIKSLGLVKIACCIG